MKRMLKRKMMMMMMINNDNNRIGRYGYASKLRRDSLQVTAAVKRELSHLLAVQDRERSEGLPVLSVCV